MTFLGLSIYVVVWKGQNLDWSSFGTGFGLAVGGAATGIGLKSRMERGDGPKDGDK